MKKTLFVAAVAALFTFASCQKEEAPVKDGNGDLVFTASIDGQSTRTSINAQTGKVSWVSGDEITITDNASTSAKYTVATIDAQGKATFTKKGGEPSLGDGPYTAVYGEGPVAGQTYSATASALPMSASSSTTDLTFTVSCGLLELSLKAGEKVTSIEVTGTPTGETETTYTLTCSTPVSIASGAKFYIALPAGSYTKVLINGENGAKCKKEKSGESEAAISIAANQITHVSFSTSLHFVVQLWSGGPYWATTNIGAETPEAYGQYFAWGHPTGQTPSETTFSTAYNDSTKFSYVDMSTLDATHDMATGNWGAGWSVPTAGQLDTLVNYVHTTATAKSYGKCSVTNVTEGVKGVRITGTTEGYTSNSIFLPAAGYGFQSNLKYAGEKGGYWSSEQKDHKTAYRLLLSDGVKSNNKLYGYSVRPVRSSL